MARKEVGQGVRGFDEEVLSSWLALSLMFALAVFTGSGANAATSPAWSCNDTVQLQNWFSQNSLPGIDQYNLHPGHLPDADGLPGPVYLRAVAQYLQNLSDEIPAVRADLSVWAMFSDRVAGGASQAELASGVQVARNAAEQVKVWLATKSGCPPLYALLPVPVTSHHEGRSDLLWVIGGACAVVFLGAFRYRRAPREGDGGQRAPDEITGEASPAEPAVVKR
jgi:hypothetical protein